MVEHETGLEILYIAGSIASLIGLIPVVFQAWGIIIGCFDRHHANHIQRVEIRRIDTAGNFLEGTQHGLPVSSAFPINVLSSALFGAARVLENDLQTLRDKVQSHSQRLAGIEKGLKAAKGVTTQKQTNKKSSNKALKKDAAKSHRAS